MVLLFRAGVRLYADFKAMLSCPADGSLKEAALRCLLVAGVLGTGGRLIGVAGQDWRKAFCS